MGIFNVELSKDSIVNQRTGVAEGPGEYVDNLRLLETTITRYDADIVRIAGELKAVKQTRESAIAALREAVREGKVLPLLEATTDADADADDPSSDE